MGLLVAGVREWTRDGDKTSAGLRLIYLGQSGTSLVKYQTVFQAKTGHENAADRREINWYISHPEKRPIHVGTVSIVRR